MRHNFAYVVWCAGATQVLFHIILKLHCANSLGRSMKDEFFQAVLLKIYLMSFKMPKK